MTNESHNNTTLQQKIQWEMEKLKQEMGLDFVAVALADGDYRDIYWRFALGANSDRYKRITVRMGRGMAGKVLQGRSPYIVTSFPEEVREEVLEYPIFLVESLKSGVGVSVRSLQYEGSRAYGVLLIGQRSSREFSHTDIEHVELCANVLSRIYDSEAIDSDRLDEKVGTEESILDMETGAILHLLHQAQIKGVTCELLDQRITRLTTERQDELAAILSIMLHNYETSVEHPQLIIDQDELGQTLIEFQCSYLYPASQQLFQPVIEQIKSLKCDLEIVRGESIHSVRFTIPTRQLLDEMNWNL